MKLVITIDTEEDNWGQYDLADYSLENIERIGKIQALFDRYGVKPTYLVTYPVATDKSAIYRLRRIMEDDKCEIGVHCHPWCTPPFEEEKSKRNSMLSNLSPDLQRKKIDTIHQKIIRNFGIVPTSFRAGRWGFQEDAARHLVQLRYKVDSSIMAFQDWTDYGGPNYMNVFPKPFIYNFQEDLKREPCFQLMEVPATAGFLQKHFALCNRIWLFLGGGFMRKMRLRGVLGELGVLNKIWLSPETSSVEEMMGLTTVMMNEGYQILNMFFHSSTLKFGLTPYTKTRPSEDQFMQRVEDYLISIADLGVESIRLSEVSLYA